MRTDASFEYLSHSLEPSLFPSRLQSMLHWYCHNMLISLKVSRAIAFSKIKNLSDPIATECFPSVPHPCLFRYLSIENSYTIFLVSQIFPLSSICSLFMFFTLLRFGCRRNSSQCCFLPFDLNAPKSGKIWKWEKSKLADVPELRNNAPKMIPSTFPLPESSNLESGLSFQNLLPPSP